MKLPEASRICLFAILAFYAGLATAQEIDLNDRLVARYPFDGDADNQVENTNHGNTFNISYTDDRYGKSGACASFNGINAKIVIPHTEDLNWDARSESYSIVFWVKSTDPTGSNPDSRRLLSKWNEILSEPYPFSFQYGPVNIGGHIFDTDSPFKSHFDMPWDDEWHCLAMVYDHLNHTLTSYQDGRMIETSSKEIRLTTLNSADIAIGHTKTTSITAYYQGLLDDLFFYKRALHPCEIEALYSGTLLIER